MLLHDKIKKYAEYLSLTEKQKKKRLDKAEQNKEHTHNPQKNHQFP
jgi:cytoskeletal protein RodZ